MIQIIDCRVDSNPQRIRFRWVGDFELGGIEVEKSTVSANGRARTKLSGWTQESATSVALPASLAGGPWNAYDVVLTRPGPVAGSGAGYAPAPGDVLELKFASLDARTNKLENEDADAIVDYPPPDPSLSTLAQASGEVAATTGRMASSADQLTQHADDLAQRADDLARDVATASDSVAGIHSDLGQLTGFPVQVYDGLAAPASGPASSPAGQAKALVDREMRSVLGRTPASAGLPATLSALDRSFAQVDEDGAHLWTWRPQSYAVQSDIGAGVTGKQASLARLIATIGEEITPLVGALTPLLPETQVNPDTIDASRVIFNESWPRLSAELNSDGGPRIVRARRLLKDAARNLQRLGILLGMFAGTAQLMDGNLLEDPDNWVQPTPVNVVTSDDDENFTNFLIAYDRVGLAMKLFQKVYTQSPPADRGTVVVILQRALDALGDAAQATYAALDSVNLGDDERVRIPVDGQGLMVEDVLSWAAAFPVDEAAPLLQDAGNIGAQSIAVRAGDLQTAVKDLASLVQAPPADAPPGIAHPRVQNAVGLLDGALSSVITQAQLLTPPTPSTP